MPLSEAAHELLVNQLALSFGAHAQLSIIKTHSASVILAGAYAYKIKRPVKLPFLDFSSLAKRQACCLKELALNKRTAADLYLAVVPISGSPDAPVLDGPGQPIEWALKMRRFQAGMLLCELAQSGRLEASHIRSLAHHLVQFHRAQKPLTAATIAGVKQTPAWFAESIDELRQLCADDNAVLIQLNELAQWHTLTLARLANTSVERVAHGCYRDVHGDLHLANLTSTAAGVVAFDALEFNDDLRRIDLLNEVAFTFMDLCSFGYKAYAWLFLNLYMHAMGDYGGLNQLEYYLRYRALVRAKVTRLQLKMVSQSSGATQPEQPEQQLQRWQRYWSLALHAGVTHKKPLLILVAGLSGSGKSTVADFLSQYLGALWLRADVERKRLFAPSSTAERYSLQASTQTYTHLAKLARRLLKSGLNVVVDATFLKQYQIDIFTRLNHDLLDAGYEPQVHAVNCKASTAAMQSRICARALAAQDPSEANVAVLVQQQDDLKRGAALWPFTLTELSNDGSIAELAAKVEQLSRQWL